MAPYSLAKRPCLVQSVVQEGKKEHPLQQILLSRLPPVEMMVEVRGDVGSAVMPKFVYSYHVGIDPGMPTPLLFRIN